MNIFVARIFVPHTVCPIVFVTFDYPHFWRQFKQLPESGRRWQRSHLSGSTLMAHRACDISVEPVGFYFSVKFRKRFELAPSEKYSSVKNYSTQCMSNCVRVSCSGQIPTHLNTHFWHIIFITRPNHTMKRQETFGGWRSKPKEAFVNLRATSHKTCSAGWNVNCGLENKYTHLNRSHILMPCVSKSY
jgi:hypothetical protein